jgi:capsular exopolysaccharide synthesis family protein
MNTNDTMQLLDLLRAVRQRWRLVVLIAVVTTATAVAASLSSPKQYDASADLLLRGPEPVNTLLDPNSGGGSVDPERELNTQRQLITVASNAHAVRRALNLRRSADDLLEQVETDTTSASNIVTLKVRDRDPLMAARIANAFATTYVQFRVESARRRYLEAAELAQRQLLALSPEDRRRTAEGRELQARQRELAIAAALQTGGAEVVRRASVPTSPSRPRPKLSAVLGLFLGSLLGAGAALLLSLVDRRLKDEQEIEAFFDLPILAAIPRPARRGLALDDPAQREAYGLLAANLRLSVIGQAVSVVMITSPGPGEGKTSVTIGAARAFARLGLSVLAIEADLRRPTFGRYTDVGMSEGLSGVLDGKALADELIWLDPGTLRAVDRDDVDGAIGVLPAGELPITPERTLAGRGMDVVIEAARSMADVVLIDTAPVGTVNDAAIVARFVDGVAVVARLNQTTKDAGRRASRTLSNVGADVLGVILTDARGSERHVYYSATPPVTGSLAGVRGRAQDGAD